MHWRTLACDLNLFENMFQLRSNLLSKLIGKLSPSASKHVVHIYGGLGPTCFVSWLQSPLAALLNFGTFGPNCIDFIGAILFEDMVQISFASLVRSVSETLIQNSLSACPRFLRMLALDLM